MAGLKEINKMRSEEMNKKRLEAMNKKRQEFKEKQKIVKNGLLGIDKKPNKKVIFTDNDDAVTNNYDVSQNKPTKSNRNELFDNEESEDEVNFEIKEQFEGKKGQKILELQTKFKSDKRFMINEQFIEDNDDMDESNENKQDSIDVGQSDEKAKQLDILQNVLGVTIKSRSSDISTEKDKKNLKSKLGMLRFDPMQPQHAKYLAPVDEVKQEQSKGRKKKKTKDEQIKESNETDKDNVNKVEVSQEQYYKVSDTLKEAIAQPNEFSLRSLFHRNDEDDVQMKDSKEEEQFIPLVKAKEPKVKNPFEQNDKNPFKYDSSDSESEEPEKVESTENDKNETSAAVWREKLFFGDADIRLEEGLAFFNAVRQDKANKDRRELKSLMKKRLHNRERNDKMFKKKIGGKRHGPKKSFRKKS